MKKGEIKPGNPQAIASEIYGLICSSLVYKIRTQKEINISILYKEYEKTLLNKLAN